MRYVILDDVALLADVAAFWPFASIEQVALWVVESSDQQAAERFAHERFPAQQWVVMDLPSAESIVRQHLESAKRRSKSTAFARRIA